MEHQPGFSEYEFAGKRKVTRREKFLASMEEVVPWDDLLAAIKPAYPDGRRGRPPIGLERMRRLYFLQQWNGLADEALEDMVYDSQAMRSFLGINLSTDPVPDATTLLKFRRLLEENAACSCAKGRSIGRSRKGASRSGRWRTGRKRTAYLPRKKSESLGAGVCRTSVPHPQESLQTSQDTLPGLGEKPPSTASPLRTGQSRGRRRQNGVKEGRRRQNEPAKASNPPNTPVKTYPTISSQRSSKPLTATDRTTE